VWWSHYRDLPVPLVLAPGEVLYMFDDPVGEGDIVATVYR